MSTLFPANGHLTRRGFLGLAAAGAATFGLSACATDMGYGYSGVSVGIGSGGYYAPYYGGYGYSPYGYDYGYGYGYPGYGYGYPSYGYNFPGGWYGSYYWPGTG